MKLKYARHGRIHNVHCRELTPKGVLINAPAIVTARLQLYGQFTAAVFIEWICDRANRLGLTGWLKCHSDQYLELEVTGHQVLVDAMETACSLGPISADVEQIDVQIFSDLQIHSGFTVIDP